MKKLSLIFLFFLLLSASYFGVVYGKKYQEKKPLHIPPVKIYSSACPFNQKISKNPLIDPNSDKMIQSLIDSRKDKGFLIALKKWTTPVYFADRKTKIYDVRLTADWAPATHILLVPIPSYALADPEEDGHMTIIDKSNGWEYDFWQAKKVGDEWTATWGNGLSANGDGLYKGGLSARGSGFALLAGVIWPHELRQGRIRHALLFSYDYVKAGGPTPPATESDGTSTHSGAIPYGARIQLHPRLDLRKFKLTRYELIVARCLQEYGMILGDSGGGVQLYAVNPISSRENSYKGYLPDKDFIYLPNIPFQYFRVLKLSPQVKDPDKNLPTGGIIKFKRK